MNTTPHNVSDNQEIDLSQISKKIGQSFDGFLSWIFRCIQFILRNIIYFIVLGLLGILIGYFLDKGSKSYNHEIYVNPNFGSTNLVYSKIDLLESKIKERDTLFFELLGLKNAKNISKIEIEPVIDIYGFINERNNNAPADQNTQNFELLKLLAENTDINKIIKEDLTGRNYGTHIIHISTKGKVNKENLIDPILMYLNDEDFYKKIQKEYIANINNKIEKNEDIIKQIDIILDEFSSKTTMSQKSDKLIYYNENTQLNEIINTKNELVSTQGSLKLELLSLSKIINDRSTVLNVKDVSIIFVKMKFIIPVILILGFISLVNIRSFYKRQLSNYKKRV